jgi:hypothetical protein
MMSDQQKINSLLVKLEHNKAFNGLELRDVIDELINLSAPIDKVTNLVERGADAGHIWQWAFPTRAA